MPRLTAHPETGGEYALLFLAYVAALIAGCVAAGIVLSLQWVA